MVPIKGQWTRFSDFDDQLDHYRLWGLIPPKSKKLRPIMVVDGYWDAPEPCTVVGYQSDNWAVIELPDGFHAIHGECLAELQPIAQQKLPHGMCFVEILERYVVLDIETTGFDFHRDRIIEIAAVSYAYGKKVAEYHTLVNPEMLIPSDIVKLTGITQAMVDTAPVLNDVANDFFDFIADLPIIGHNVLSFDVPFLSTQLTHIISNTVIDTLPMARKVFDLLPRHKLDYLNNVLQLGSAGAHRAFHDVETTNNLLWACMAPRKYERQIFGAFLDAKMHTAPSAPVKRPAKKTTYITQKKSFEKVDIKSITPSCDCSSSSSPLCGKAIVFTGELSIPREDAMQIAVNAGAILKSGVSRKISYLVVGKQDITLVGKSGMSSKEIKAHELNDSGKAQIQILSEDQFIELAKKAGAENDGTA